MLLCFQIFSAAGRCRRMLLKKERDESQEQLKVESKIRFQSCDAVVSAENLLGNYVSEEILAMHL